MNKPYKNKEWLQKQYDTIFFSQTIGKNIGVSGDTIEYWRKKHGIEKPKAQYPKNRKYYFDEDYFETIDTEHKAYWLGFLMADGCVSKTSKCDKNPNRISINLKKEDKSHLEKFKNDLKAINTNLKHKTANSKGHTSETVELRLSSVKMATDLINHNVTPRKTGQEIIPKISNELIKHFVRGFFDGDGCIYRNNKYLCFSICSASKRLIDQLKSIFNSIGVECYIEERTEYSIPFYVLGTKNQKNIKLLFEYLYNNATIYLNRKYDKFKTICPVNK